MSFTYDNEASNEDQDTNERVDSVRADTAARIERLLDYEAKTLALREEHRRWVRFGEREGSVEVEVQGEDRSEERREEREIERDMKEMERDMKGSVAVGEREFNTLEMDAMVGFV